MTVTEMSFQAASAEAAPEQAIEGRGQWALTWARLRHDKMAIASIIVILIMVTLALGAPIIAAIVGHPANVAYTGKGLTADGLPVPPGHNGFLAGTDYVGRDLFVRIMYGARVSLFVGFVTTAIGTAAGVSIGLIAGYFGGLIDNILARFIDVFLAFPVVVLALALAVVIGPSLTMIIGVISFFSWAAISRIVRGQTLALKEKEYVEAARSLGAGPWRIMFSHILPNLLGPVLVLATLSIPAAIVFEATLSFLGVGIQPPTASWGNILEEATGFYNTSWWYVVFPALALLITTLAFNLLGDGIRDAIDPRTERLFSGQRRRKNKTATEAELVAVSPVGLELPPPSNPTD
jgi:peptide/nickel transport system permease protein